MQIGWFPEAFPGKRPSEPRPEGSERANHGCLGKSVPGREQPLSYMREGGRVRARCHLLDVL